MYITCVTNSSDPKRIESVGIRASLTWTSAPVTYQRDEVVKLINSGQSVKTAVVRDGRWVVGEDVITVKIGNEWFIKTERNSTERDNLGSLPSC